MRSSILRVLGLLGLLVAGALGLPSNAHAQCAGGLIDNCPKAVSPLNGDLALTWQNSQTPHTRAMTLQQVLQGALGAPLTVKLSAMPSGSGAAGLNLGVGFAPTQCVSGDLWATSAGLFSCINGQSQGPYSVGGSTIPVYASAANLPAVTSAQQGNQAFVSNCQNGSQGTGAGTGCAYIVSATGVWTAEPSPPSQSITIGGQNIFLGGSTTNQGNGPKVQLATGTFVVGHALAYDNNGNAVDSGVPPSGGSGGSGTVTASPQNAIPFYSSAGSSAVVSGMTIVNNAVVATGASGIPAEVTTLPSGLTIPSAILTSPTLSGTISIGAATYTGKQSLAASVASAASANMPPGVAPSSPVNGDLWETTTGLFGRVNGTTQGPYLYSVTTSSPLSGGGTGPTLALACATCATTTNGGPLSATAPLTISAGGLIALGAQPQPLVFIADSTTVIHNDTYPLIEKWSYVNSGTINSVTYHTGGTSTPSFQIALTINGVNVGGCNGLSVSSATDTTTTCTSANTITNGQTLGLVITNTAGTPSSAVVQVNMSKPAS